MQSVHCLMNFKKMTFNEKQVLITWKPTVHIALFKNPKYITLSWCHWSKSVLFICDLSGETLRTNFISVPYSRSIGLESSGQRSGEKTSPMQF